MSLKLLHEPETEDPILSVVNLIDIFLVIIAALLITVAQNPLINPFNKQDVTVITDSGKPTMEVMIKKGEKIEKYKANGNIGSGDGEKAGVAYRMKDGSMVYVPEGAPAAQPAARRPAALALACRPACKPRRSGAAARQDQAGWCGVWAGWPACICWPARCSAW